MVRVLIVAEHAGGSLSAATAKVLSCASQMGDAELSIAVFAADGAAIAEQAARLPGVAKVLRVDDPRHAHPLAALIAPQLIELTAGYTHVFGSSSTFGRDLMPRLAALLGVPQVSDVAAVEGPARFRRPVYAGNAVITVEVEAPVIVATVRVASFPAAEPGPTRAPIELVQPQTELPSHTRFVSLSGAAGTRPDLQSAARVVSGGRAFGSTENFEKLYRVADLLGAAVGASRAAVDAGFAPNEVQIGQTGKIIAPELYMAFGISGAIQHLTGIKDARVIVAVNRDAQAPIFEVADIAMVADVFAVLSELETALQT
jgi:electron transfer flavoprotein alpha subunit